MRILFVTHGFPPECIGGTELYAERLAHALLAAGHAVEVFSGSLHWEERLRVERSVQDGLPVTRIHRDDLYFDHWDKVDDPHVAALYERELERFRPDLVHLHHWIRLDGSLVRRAAARGVPVVVHLHDLFVTCPRVFRIREQDRYCEERASAVTCLHCVPRWKFQSDVEISASLEHYAREFGAELRAATTVVAPTASHARRCRELLGLEEGRIEVLSHPALAASSSDATPCAHSPPGRLRAVFASHLHPVKGLHVVAEALHLLGPESGIELHVFGGFATADHEEKVRALLTDLPVHFHGPYAPGTPARVPADCVLVPSLAAESHSFWLDEALASGLPVLASDFGALRERGGDRVRRVPRGDPRAWADALCELRDDLGERARRSAAAVEPLASLDQHRTAVEALHQRARSAGAPPVEALAPPAALVREFDRREWAFRELLRSEHWEEALADLRRRLEERS